VSQLMLPLPACLPVSPRSVTSDLPCGLPFLQAQPRGARPDLARFTIWRSQTWDHGRQRPWPNGRALDERAQAGLEPELVPNATVDAVSAPDEDGVR
jgi:hypothetical protein